MEASTISHDDSWTTKDLARMPVAIVGSGCVATAFAHALWKAGIPVSQVTSRSAASAKKLAAAFNVPACALDGAPPNHGVNIVLIAVHDCALKDDQFLSQIKTAFPKSHLAIHTSGSASAAILDGIATESLALHPAAPIGRNTPTLLRGVFAALEGRERAVQFGKRFASALEMQPFCLRVSSQSKALYHAACCMSSNYTATLILSAIDALTACCEVDKATASRITADLCRRAILSVEKTVQANSIGTSALTGPIMRGDHDVVESHVKAIESLLHTGSPIGQLYRDIGLCVAEFAASSRHISEADRDKFELLLRNRKE